MKSNSSPAIVIIIGSMGLDYAHNSGYNNHSLYEKRFKCPFYGTDEAL